MAAPTHSEWLVKQAEIVDQWKKAAAEYTETALSPRRQDVQVTQFGLGAVLGGRERRQRRADACLSFGRGAFSKKSQRSLIGNSTA